MYHKLMNGGMGLGWTPEEIGKLTPVQVMCMVAESPAKLLMGDPEDAVEESRLAIKRWRA